MAAEKMAGADSRRLCKLGDLPKHLQFNKDILTGYRRPMSAKECVKSWRYLHNESFNCYSHVFALLYFLVAVRDYSTVWPTPSSATSTVVSALIVGDFVCTLLPFGLSILYHTFMPHHTGERTYQQLLKLDVFGVWWCCTLGPVANIYTGLYCTRTLMIAYFAFYTCFSIYVLYYLMVVDCKRKRVIALTAQFFVRLLIYPMRLSSLSGSSLASVKYYFIMDSISAVGALINALHIPERWLPGRVDYVFNGHTLMHVAAILSLMFARQGFLCDMTWVNEVGTCSSNHTAGLALGLRDGLGGILGAASSYL